MSEHTPGPLEVSTENGGVTYIKDTTGRYLGIVSNLADGINNDARKVEQLANAQLWATAPKLLESLKELLPLWQSGIDEPWVRRAKDAIAKATEPSKC